MKVNEAFMLMEFVDGKDIGVSPATAEIDSGVRHVQIAAPGLKTWESSVVMKSGETLGIGPIRLGQPDAELTLTSVPSGAEITVGSIPKRCAASGIAAPTAFAHVQTTRIVIATQSARS